MLVDAQFDEDDVHWRKNLAYYSTTFAGDGFVLVGDAAAFKDPFYSPGMDWISFTTSAAELITAQRRGEPMAQRIERILGLGFLELLRSVLLLSLSFGGCLLDPLA
jgi:flavin-dependent dehydrogenase